MGSLKGWLPGGLYTYLSGANLAKKFSANTIFQKVSGLVSLIITPTIRFRFSSIDADRIQNDPAYIIPKVGSTAYKTARKIESWRIGLLGSILTGVNLEWFSRAKQHPSRVMTGAVQLVACLGLAIIFGNCMMANPAPVIIGAMLA